MRIVRKVEAWFPSGPPKRGSAFLAPAGGLLITCAHVVTNDAGERANRVIVDDPAGATYSTTVAQVDDPHDLATIVTSETTAAPTRETGLPKVGEDVVFAGLPLGVHRVSVFPGMVSAVGDSLLAQPKCELIQIAGMVNNGNSGGPLLNANGAVIGVITAKYVPLLREIDKLLQDLTAAPTFPKGVQMNIGIDWGSFFEFTIQTTKQLGEVLRLVQVGTGWAVPAKYFTEVGGS